MGKKDKKDKKHKKHRHKDKRRRKESSSSESSSESSAGESDVERKRLKSEKYVCVPWQYELTRLMLYVLRERIDAKEIQPSACPFVTACLQAQRVVAHLQKGGGGFVWGKKVEKELGEGKRLKEISAFQDKARAQERLVSAFPLHDGLHISPDA